MFILPRNDLRMRKWCKNDRDENPPIPATFLSNDPGMTHFSHSDIIPSFQDEDEWDDVDHFPYRESERTLSGTKFEDRSFIKLKSNKEILKESVENKMWPIKNKQIGGRAQKADSGMQKFWQMIEKQDRTLPVSDGLLLLMSNLLTSTSTTNLFQVRIYI